MIRAVIHVGYPKTATTTLQQRWFYPLHKAGHIKYFGKYISESGTESDFESVLPRDVLKGGRNFSEQATLSNDRVNVFSDERLTLPGLVKRRSPYHDRESIDPFVIPSLLDDCTDEIDEVTILLTVRNQQSIMNSMYAHYNYYFANDPKYNSWEKFLERELSVYPSTFDYDVILDEYSKYFDHDNLEVVFFEEFVNEREIFIDRLSRILQMDVNNLRKNVDKRAHENKKKKEGNVYIKERGSDISLSIRDGVNQIHSVHKIENLLKRLVGNQRIERFKDRFFIDEVEIERPTDEQKIRIFHRFQEGNKRLSTEFGVEEERLNNYSYIM